MNAINQLQSAYNSIKSTGGPDDSYLKNFVRMPRGKGTVVVRILPPAPGASLYQETRISKVNGKNLHDPCDKVDGKWVGKNPIRDYLRYLWKKSEQAPPQEQKAMRDLYRQIKPIPRFYFNVIVREETDENGVVSKNVGPKILSVGQTLLELILRGACGDKEMGIKGYGDITDLKTGRDFMIIKNVKQSGEDAFPNYDSSMFKDELPAGDPDQCKQWMEELHDLSTLRILKSAEEIDHELKVHLGVIQENTEFDASQYEPSNNQDSPETKAVIQETKAVVQETQPVAQASTSSVQEESPFNVDETESMVDEEFFNTLRGLSDSE